MKKQILLTVAVALVGFVGSAFEIKLFDANDKPFTDTKSVKFDVKTIADKNGVKTLHCKLTNLTDSKKFIRITGVSDRFSGKDIRIFDGNTEMNCPKKRYRKELLFDKTFCMGAAWTTNKGLALALGAENLDSFADLTVIPQRNELEMRVAINAALLRKGSTYECKIHQIAFAPKYGVRDMLARFYALYPKRFKVNPEVNSAVNGICAAYHSWRTPNPDGCRWSNATWEWCHGAGRSWGDPNNTEIPTNPKEYTWDEELHYTTREGKKVLKRNTKLSLKEFEEVQQSRASNAYYCGVANGFYMMALANVSNVIGKRYPDSLITHHGVPGEYTWSTEIFTFPETSWGKEIRKQLATLVSNYDLGAIAFDVSHPYSIYRGEKIVEMNNVGFDKYGEGIVRGVASAKLFDYIHTLPCKKLPGATGVSINTKYQHITDMLYTDNVMLEMTPWDYAQPFPMESRYVMGEKALMLWEGYSPREFDPNFNKWDQESKDTLLRDLSRYAVHREFDCGASLPATYLTEYVSKTSFAFVDCNRVGWKPVIGAAVPADTQVARYGCGENCYLAVNNLRREAVTREMEIFPDELRSDLVGSDASKTPVIFASYFGDTVTNTLKGKREFVRFNIPFLLINVLEAVGTATGDGAFEVKWSGDFAAAKLTLKSVNFTGKINLRKEFGMFSNPELKTISLAPNQTVEVVYRNSRLNTSIDSLKTMPFLRDELRTNLTIEHSDDEEASEMAQRINAFFRGYVRFRKNNPKHRFGITCKVNSKLPPHTVVMVPKGEKLDNFDIKSGVSCHQNFIAVRGNDREDMNDITRKFLNALNSIRYPEYIPPVKLEETNRKFFSFTRY